MDADEREIFQFLKTWSGQFVATREICRHAGGRQRFHGDPEWAKPVLLRMAQRGILESNSTGQFRVKHVSKKGRNADSPSPASGEILKESGAETEGASEGGEIAPDEYYDEL